MRLSPAASLSGGVLGGGTAGDREGLLEPLSLCRARCVALCRGGALAEWPGEGKETTRESSGQGPGGRKRKRGPGPTTPAHPSPPRPQPPPPTTYADISFIASCVAAASPASVFRSAVLFLLSPSPPLSTFLRSLAARLLAHFLTHYGRGIQPNSENTTKPALFMTIQRGRRQYGAPSQPASRPPRPRPWRPDPPSAPPPSSLGPGRLRAPRPQGRRLWLQTRVRGSFWSPPLSLEVSIQANHLEGNLEHVFLFSLMRAYIIYFLKDHKLA